MKRRIIFFLKCRCIITTRVKRKLPSCPTTTSNPLSSLLFSPAFAPLSCDTVTVFTPLFALLSSPIFFAFVAWVPLLFAGRGAGSSCVRARCILRPVSQSVLDRSMPNHDETRHAVRSDPGSRGQKEKREGEEKLPRNAASELIRRHLLRVTHALYGRACVNEYARLRQARSL